MTRLTPTTQPYKTVFGFVLLGGSINGALIHDIRLANELHRRGYPVRVWWVVDRPDISPLSKGIPERWLFHSFRYATGAVSGVLDCVGKLACSVMSERRRSALAQRVPWMVGGTLRGLIKFVCAGVESDPHLIRRFAHELTQAKVTHLLETIEILAPFAAAARSHVTHPLQCLVQFQGYETYAPYAAQLGLEQQMYQRIREAVDSSDWPAVTVSGPYSNRIHHEIKIPFSSMQSVSPGIPIAPPIDADHARGLVQRQFPGYDPTVPLVSYLGRQDSEKGIDLLLYAARILHEHGIQFQLAICGPTAFGSRYSTACRQIAQALRLPVLGSDYLSNELRTALFRASHCVVYPSIHAEPFGMVPVEAMVQGTPVIVSDTGGVSELPFLNGLQRGLNFRTWDSGELARQLEQLLTDVSLHRRLASAAPLIAAHYSVERFTDRMLDHLGLPHWPDSGRTLDLAVTEPIDRRAA